MQRGQACDSRPPCVLMKAPPPPKLSVRKRFTTGLTCRVETTRRRKKDDLRIIWRVFSLGGLLSRALLAGSPDSDGCATVPKRKHEMDVRAKRRAFKRVCPLCVFASYRRPFSAERTALLFVGTCFATCLANLLVEFGRAPRSADAGRWLSRGKGNVISEMLSAYAHLP